MSTPKAYHGSCHCGDVQYQVKLTFPPILKIDAESIRIYKCNCTTCLKMGFFHCRPINVSDDFILTSPSTIEELGDYRAFTGKIGWYFCKKCGVRIFGLGGKWKQADVDIEKWAGEKSEGRMQKVWKTTPDPDFMVEVPGKTEKKQIHYLSVNAVTLDPDDGIDLREWHDKGWIFYVDNREKKGGTKVRFGEPHPGGLY